MNIFNFFKKEKTELELLTKKIFDLLLISFKTKNWKWINDHMIGNDEMYISLLEDTNDEKYIIFNISEHPKKDYFELYKPINSDFYFPNSSIKRRVCSFFNMKRKQQRAELKKRKYEMYKENSKIIIEKLKEIVGDINGN